MEVLNNNKNSNKEQDEERILEQPINKAQGEERVLERAVETPQGEATSLNELTHEQRIERVLGQSQSESKVNLRESKLTIGKQKQDEEVNYDEVKKRSVGELSGKILKYKKADSSLGYLTDVNQIREFKRLQQIDVLQNAMLGDYDETGQYVISEEIKAECVKARKVITNQYENYVFVETFREIQGFNKLTFFVTVSKEGENGLIAKLTLIEKVKRINGYVTNAETCLIAEHKGVRGEEFYFDMKKAFNIAKDDIKVIDDQEEIENFKYIIQKKTLRRVLWTKSLKQIEKTEKQLFESRMELLKSMGNNPNAVELLNNFRQNQLKLSNTFMNDKGNYWLTNNLLLATCLENMPIDFRNKFENEMANHFPHDLGGMQKDIYESNGMEARTHENALDVQKKMAGHEKGESLEVTPIGSLPQEVGKDNGGEIKKTAEGGKASGVLVEFENLHNDVKREEINRDGAKIFEGVGLEATEVNAQKVQATDVVLGQQLGKAVDKSHNKDASENPSKAGTISPSTFDFGPEM